MCARSFWGGFITKLHHGKQPKGIWGSKQGLLPGRNFLSIFWRKESIPKHSGLQPLGPIPTLPTGCWLARHSPSSSSGSLTTSFSFSKSGSSSWKS